MIYPLLKPKDQPRRRSAAPFRTMPDGREICSKTLAGREEYRRRTVRVWEREKGICGWCIKPVSKDEATADHIITKGHGGGKHDDREENLRPAHWLCNGERGSSPILTRVEWLAWKAGTAEEEQLISLYERAGAYLGEETL